MSPLQRGLLAGLLQMSLVGSVGAKFALDRSSYPRVWVATAPVDPELPIRGRYVRLRVRVEVLHSEPSAGDARFFQAHLEAGDHEIVAVEDENGRHRITSASCADGPCWQLWSPLAYFIPEGAVDPSLRASGEELWVEVTLPPKGPPRPIRLGVRKDGALTPL